MKMISKELELVNEHISRILVNECENSKIVEIMNWLMQAKGKQLRPRLVLLCSKFCSKPKDVTEYAACIEILHMASLVHDDVIDNSEFRRGILSVQKKFGKEMAIYAGDYMIFALASNSMLKPAWRHKKYIKIINDLCMGELSQFNNLHNMNVSIEQYLKNISGKTASLFHASCMIGANEGGCSEKRARHLSEFGKNLGMIFQIRDDLLDYFSTTEAEGKCTESDILSGMYTLPLVYAMCSKNGEMVKETVKKYCEQPGAENREKIMNQIKEAGGFDYTRELIKEYKNKCDENLKALPDIPEKEELQNILNYVSTLPESK